jgi:hypothetical protein
MKLKYILIIIGSMSLLLGLMLFSTTLGYRARSINFYQPISIISSVIGLGTLLTGIFWKKQ